MAFRRILLALALGSTLSGLPLQAQDENDAVPVPVSLLKEYPFDLFQIVAAYEAAKAGTPVVVEVHAFYDQLSLQKVGRAALEKLIRDQYAECSRGLIASGANMEYRVVGVEPAPPKLVSGATVGNTSKNLIDFRANKQVARKILRSGTDLAQLWVWEGSAGRAYGPTKLTDFVPGAGFSITLTRSTSKFMACHELSHNAAAGHDESDSSQDLGDFTYRLGFVDAVSGYCDWMSVAKCFRVPRISGPTSIYVDPFTNERIVLGNAAHDNARVLRLTAPLLADYDRRRGGWSLDAVQDKPCLEQPHYVE